MIRLLSVSLRLAVWVGSAFTVLAVAPTPAQASYTYNSGCDSPVNAGSAYTVHCYAETINNNGGGNIDDTSVMTVSVPGDVDLAKLHVTSVSARDTGYFEGPGFSIGVGWCGSGNTCTNSQGWSVAASGSFGISIRRIGPNGYARADINFRLGKQSGTVLTSCTAVPNPTVLGQTTTLTGFGSDPWGGEVSQYQWDFGDGSTGVTDAGGGVSHRVASVPSPDLPPLLEALAPTAAHAGGGGWDRPPTATASLTANPSSIVAGESSTLTWSASGLDQSSFTITATNKIGTRTATLSFPSGTLTVATESPGSAPVAAATEPTIAQRIASVIGQSLHPKVAEAAGGGLDPTEPPEFVYFTASEVQPGVPSGSYVTLSWQFYSAESITSNFGVSTSTGSTRVQVSYVTVTSNFSSGALPLSGSAVVTPALSTLYSMTVTDMNGPATATAAVAVNRPPISHPYTQAGSYTVKVTATSSSGNTGSGTCTVTVEGGGPPPVTLTGGAVCVADTGQTTVSLSWTTSPGAASYAVVRTLGGVSTRSSTTATSFTDTLSTPAGVPYSYTVESVSSAGSTPSNAVTGTTNCPSVMSLRLDPASIPGIAPGGRRGFTVIPTVNQQVASSATIIGGTLTVQWEVSDTAVGTITQDPTNPFKATYVAGTVPNQYPDAIIATVTLTPARGSAITEVVKATVTIGTLGITGDVYAGGDITNLKVDKNSVVSASGLIDRVTGTSFTIPGYTTANSLQWETARRAVHDQAVKLLQERVDAAHVLKDPGGGYVLGGTSCATFNLNPIVSATSTRSNPCTNGPINQTRPEGTVWFVAGDLTIKGPVSFKGRGTIIVDGNITIQDGVMSYVDAESSLGLIANPLTPGWIGNVTVTSTVSALVGAYFTAAGLIDIVAPTAEADAGQLTATGLFVGNEIRLDRPVTSIGYDARIATQPPPGFAVVQSPGTKETAP